MDIDDLQLYRGKDIKISDYIVLHHPSLDEIYEYGEREYFSLISSFTAVGADLKWQLDDMGLDYTKISDFELFYGLIIKSLTKERTSIIFGDLDFTKFDVYTNTKNNETVLMQEITINKEIKYTITVEKDLNKLQKFIFRILKKDITYEEEKTDIISENVQVIIDAFTYELIATYLRKIHGYQKNEQKPANESTRRILIEDDRDEYMRNINKEYQSQLLNLISTMVNSSGFKYNHEDVWNLKIYSFFNSVKRITKIKNADLLLQSGYSGYGINLKEINNKQIDWLGELD